MINHTDNKYLCEQH